RGPLPAAGCPRCQVRAFVVPVRASDDPVVAARVSRLPHPSVEPGGIVPEDAPATTSDAMTPVAEILQQGKIKR
ncbi:MAG: hypothetical protein H7145_17380, partial [Akkermansiaceae bacterium]|nr:hypothetical protein [Armatimonadota bacterium]